MIDARPEQGVAFFARALERVDCTIVIAKGGEDLGDVERGYESFRARRDSSSSRTASSSDLRPAVARVPPRRLEPCISSSGACILLANE